MPLSSLNKFYISHPFYVVTETIHFVLMPDDFIQLKNGLWTEEIH